MGYKKVVAAFYRGVLSARYRVRLEGAGLLAERRATLFLPNHQASVDPQIVCSQLLRYVDVSPLVTEGYFKIPLVAQVLHLMNAVRVPDLEKSRRGVEIVAGLNRVVIDALVAGHNVLLYPARAVDEWRVGACGEQTGGLAGVPPVAGGYACCGYAYPGVVGEYVVKGQDGALAEFRVDLSERDFLRAGEFAVFRASA